MDGAATTEEEDRLIDPHDLLKHIPDDVLLEAVKARGLVDEHLLPPDDAVIVGDLEVDPVGCVATWRGAAVRLSRRETEVLYALATMRWQGIRVVRPERFAAKVFRGWEQREALDNLRVHLSGIRGKLPGLIGSKPYVGYWLNVDGAQEAAA